MFTREDLSEFEQLVQANVVELEKTDLKNDLRGIVFSSAKQIDMGQKSAILITVPPPMLPRLHKVQPRLVRELEKKFSDCHVLFVAERRIIRKNDKSLRQKRPISRTLTSVHEAILHDLVYPTEIVGKRTRVLVDGSKILKIFLDRKDHTSLEYKLDTFSACYKKLTGKNVVFEFPLKDSE